MENEKKIYLDYAATTPVDERVLRAMQPYFSEKYGNANAIHSFGQEALKAIDDAKETIARAIGAKRGEIIFTPSASASNKLAMEQTVERALDVVTFSGKPNIIVSSIEHSSVIHTAKKLEERGIETRMLPVDKRGIVDLEGFRNLLDERTVFVSVMYVNNEIGTVEPLAEIAKIIKEFRKSQNAYPLFHTDASHGPQYLSCNVDELGVDAMTLCAHKLCGPKGIGALYTRGERLEPELEKATANTPAIVGFSAAVELASGTRKTERERMERLAEYFIQRVEAAAGDAELNGIPEAKHSERVPHIVSVYFPGRDGEELLIKLDMAGVAVSTGAACAARAIEPSHVVRALGYGADRAKSTLRFSFGRWTTKEELDEALERLKKIL